MANADHQQPLLQTENLRLSANGAPLLAGLSLNVNAGQVVSLMGESGSGKSLTALSILGLLPDGVHRQGRIVLDGRDIGAMTDAELDAVRGRDIGMVFQEPMTALNPLMTIGDQVAEVVRVHARQTRRVARQRAQEALERVGLPATAFGLDRYPHELSGGQRQRVAIAMAIVLKPRLLIADEPTTALDVSTQAQILSLLKSLVQEDGCGLILVTHDLAVVAQMADAVVVLRAGQVIEQGDAEQVLTAPASDYTARLIKQARLSPASPNECSGPSDGPLLDVVNVTRTYRHRRDGWGRTQIFHAVQSVSLTVGPGERVGLVGESGCGKSTLLRTVLGLERAQAGEVRLKGQRFSGRERELRRAIQIVFQDPHGSFDPRWRVSQLVAEPLHLLDEPIDAATQRGRVAQCLQQVGLRAEDADRYPHQFSGGQRQRIAIARALITRPDLLVLDEAVSALDVSIRAQILDLLQRLSSELGIAYLFISHDLAVVRAVTDRVYVMAQGRIVEAGPTQQVFTQPTHPYTNGLVAASPDLDQALRARRAFHTSPTP